jgi:uncharacterized protein involved in type VI secretion and phage assembly
MAQHGTNAFKIEVDGSPLPDAVAAALIEAYVEDELNLPDAVELVFRDPQRTLIEAGRFAIGKKLKVSVASEAAAGGTLIFDGEIIALEAEVERDRSVAVVRGLDPAHRLQRGTNTETHLDVTYGDVVSKVAQRCGLQQGDGGTNSVVHEAVVQWNQTDWEFLSKLAAEIGHEIVVADRKLHLRVPKESSEGPGAGNLQRRGDPRQLVAGGNLVRLRAALSGAEQVGEVEVRGWDFRAKEAVTGTAKASDTSLSASAGSGAASLADALGGGTLVKTDLPVESNETAQDAADSLIEQLGSAAAEIEGTAEGDPGLRAGVAVSVAGAGTSFDGKYVLTSCRHTYDTHNGYQTSFRVSGRQTRTLLGLVRGKGGSDGRTVPGVVNALVSNIDDPDGLGRIKVTFPWLGDKSETHWVRVAAPGAGNERGALFMSEVGDEVLVAFAHGDARLPYVIGGLYNGQDKPAVAGAVDNGKVVQRVLVARNGHRLVLDDKDDVITLATGDGNHKVVIDQKSKKVVVDTAGDVEVTAQQQVTIKAGSSMTLEAQGAFELKANGVTIDAGGGAFSAKGSQATVQGSGTAEISSSGQTTVRGSVVSIN